MSAEYFIRGWVRAPAESHERILAFVGNKPETNFPDDPHPWEHETFVETRFSHIDEPENLSFHSFRTIGLTDGLNDAADRGAGHVRVKEWWSDDKHKDVDSFEILVVRQTRDRILKACPTADVVCLTVVCLDYAEPSAYFETGEGERVNGGHVIACGIPEPETVEGDIRPRWMSKPVNLGPK